jgi:hypothetical protein
MAAHTVPLA